MKNKSTPEFPFLISFDERAFTENITRLERLAKVSIPDIADHYYKAGLGELTDDIWKRLITDGTGFLNSVHQQNVKKIADLIGVTAGITKKEVLNELDLNSFKISEYLLAMRSAISNNQFLEYLDFADIVDVMSDPHFSEPARHRISERFKHYVHNRYESEIKETLEMFASQYSTFLNKLVHYGYGPHIESIYFGHLTELFNETSELRLVARADAIPFLAKFRPENVRMADINAHEEAEGLGL